MADVAASFLPHRTALIRLAYRMTGSRATAEDIAQEVFLRWERAERQSILHARVWLMKTAAWLALDYLKSAKVRREAYVGPWIPEPVLDSDDAPQGEWKKAGLKIRLGPFSAFFEPEGGSGMGGETGSQKRLGRG